MRLTVLGRVGLWVSQSVSQLVCEGSMGDSSSSKPNLQHVERHIIMPSSC